MNTARYHDVSREIKHSFGRFLSIFIIVALGCGFFAGIKATMPDMIDSAEEYFEDNNLMDLKLMSSIGIRSSDVQAVRNANGVQGAMPGYSKDVLYNYNDQNVVLKVMSYNHTMDKESSNYMNNPVLLEGRFPEKSGECVVEVKISSPDTFEIGNQLTLTSAYSDEEMSDTFATDTYEIVGIVTSPLYIGFERDATPVGNGEVLSYIMVPEEDFVADYYSELYITFDGLEDYQPFSDEYVDAVNEKKAAAIDAFKASVNERYDSLVADAQQSIDSATQELSLLEQVLAYSNDELNGLISSGQAQLDVLQKQYDKAVEDDSSAQYLYKSQLLKYEEKLSLCNELLSARLSNEISADEKYATQISHGKEQLKQSRQEFDEVKALSFYEFNRFSSSDYSSYYGDSQKVDSIAKVFPVFFLIVAALVCLTTMTRMIDEERIQIGTYKALGYSSGKIIFKYEFYGATATLLGAAIGTTIGLQVFPSIIYDSYKMMYNIPDIATPFKLEYVFWCSVVALSCTCLTIVSACVKTLKAHPAQLMRPKAPTAGKRVIMEKIPFIWNKLDFLAKVTVRNLLRYKKRFLMTIVGVAGCTALILTGFALKYSIKSIADKQFEEIFLYDATVSLQVDDKFTSQNADDFLTEYSEINSHVMFKIFSGNGETEGESQSVSLFIAQSYDNINEYISMQDVDGDMATINDDGVVITEKMAKLLNLDVGDLFTLKIDELKTVNVKVNSIVKNYAGHYVYMSPKMFQQVYSQEPVYNMSFINISDNVNDQQFKECIVADDHILGISYKADSAKGFLSSVDSLDSIVLMLIICAGFLAIVVLYNLANININERTREIATIKVLGFYDNETSAYIYRENIISAVIGIMLGWGIGILLHYFVVVTAEVDIVMFNREIKWWAFALSALFTMVFTVIVNMILHFKIKKIDMVESLKSME